MLTLILTFIYSLFAKQLYSIDLIDANGNPSRYSFNSTTDSLITVFIVLTGENWNEIMIEVIDKTQDYTHCIFFISLIMIGNYMLLNLFLAVLLKFIISQKEIGDMD